MTRNAYGLMACLVALSLIASIHYPTIAAEAQPAEAQSAEDPIAESPPTDSASANEDVPIEENPPADEKASPVEDIPSVENDPALSRPKKSGEDDFAGYVVVCPIDGMIDDGIGVVVERAIREAEYAEAIIFVIDTPGGRVDSCLNIVEAILDAPCHTIAYIEGMGAISAGAIISFACQDMVMSPTANMGDAAPVVPTQEGMLPLGEKEVSFLRAKMKSLAEHNDHNPAIARAMVDKDIELWARRLNQTQWEVFEPTEGEKQRARDQGLDVATQVDPLQEVIDQATESLPEPMRDAARDVAKATADAIKREIGADAPSPSEDEQVEQQPEEPPPLASGNVGELELVLARGKLLTLTAKDAQRYGVIETTALNLDQVFGLYGYEDAERIDIEMTMPEKTFRWLTNPMIAGILLLLGIGGLYFEVKTPGFGVPGVIGVVCLALFFGARAVLGLADWIDIALIATGLGLIAVEIFVLPGFGIAGISGIVCLLVGLYLSFTLNDLPTLPEFSWEFDRLRDAGLTLSITMISLPILIFVLWKILPHTPVYRRIILGEAQLVEDGYVVQTAQECQEAIGQEGIAASTLRPAGRGRFGDRTYQVVSRGEFIAKGTPIVIAEADGNRYVVDKVPVAHDAAEKEEA